MNIKQPKIKQPKVRGIKMPRIKGIGLPKHPRVFGSKKR